MLTTLPPLQATAQGRSAPPARNGRGIRPIRACKGFVVSMGDAITGVIIVNNTTENQNRRTV